MSNLLWRAFYEEDVEKFTNLLGLGDFSPANAKAKQPQRKASSTAPRIVTKLDVNSRDHAGLTLLHRTASSHAAAHIEMGELLLQFKGIDLYATDKENGWTALHRALYAGNAQLARDILAKEGEDLAAGARAGTAIKGKTLLSRIKDFEGNTAYDIYNATVAAANHDKVAHPFGRFGHHAQAESLSDSSDSDTDHDQVVSDYNPHWKFNKTVHPIEKCLRGDEVFAWGSNKNLTLGFGNEDDRAYPERVSLKRPEHLIWRFYREYIAEKKPWLSSTRPDPTKDEDGNELFLNDLPTLIRNKPIVVQDVQLSKLHSAILTADPEANLYVCGIGHGGRLGTGDERTRFSYECTFAGALQGRKVTSVALGLNHTLALVSEGEVISWGSNTHGVLGYTLPTPKNNKEPINVVPRQIFGPLKKEIVAGVAASAIHSAAWTTTSLYVWGKNDGQLGIMDADARSLEIQTTPRRVGASLFKDLEIAQVTCTENATVVLLRSGTVRVFTNYGYTLVNFPVIEFMNNLRSDTVVASRPIRVSQVASGGNTIAAVSEKGDLFTVSVASKPDGSSTSSTTNPGKLKKTSMGKPVHVWSLRKGNWDGVKSVDVGDNGNIVLCTKAGAVWRRTKRPNAKDAIIAPTTHHQSERSKDHVGDAFTGIERKSDFMFSRVPSLTGIIAVRANSYGGYAAVRRDDLARLKLELSKSTLRDDIASLFPFANEKLHPLIDPKRWQSFGIARVRGEWVDGLSNLSGLDLTEDVDVEAEVKSALSRVRPREDFDLILRTTQSEIAIPAHRFAFAARSPALRNAFHSVQKGDDEYAASCYKVRSTSSENSKVNIEIIFEGMKFEALYNLVLYVYHDILTDFWSFPRSLLRRPDIQHSWRETRVHLMQMANALEMHTLERDVRAQQVPTWSLSSDYHTAVRDKRWLDTGDIIVDLDGGESFVYSPLIRARCPFFGQLFGGRSQGQWLAGRRATSTTIRVDLKHIKPEIWDLVLQYLYSDCGVELFDDITAPDVNAFAEVVVDVLKVADELMLDRLAEICQKVLSHHVKATNIVDLVNAMVPFSVQSLKQEGLKYIAAQLEMMLENRLLDHMDDELWEELDDVVRDGVDMRVRYGPFEELDEADLEDLASQRESLLRDMDFRAQLAEERRAQGIGRGRLASVDANAPSTAQDKRKASTDLTASGRPGTSDGEKTMFELDDDSNVTLQTVSPFASVKVSQDAIPIQPTLSPRPSQRQLKRLGRNNAPSASPLGSTPPAPSAASPHSIGISPKVWSSPTTTPKVGMKDIFSEALATPVSKLNLPAKDRKSSLSMEVAAQRASDAAATLARTATPKLSQRERKQQAKQKAAEEAETAALAAAKGKDKDRAPAPWVVAKGAKVDLKDVEKAEPTNVDEAGSAPRRAGSADTRFSGQPGASSSMAIPEPKSKPSTPGFAISHSMDIKPHSKVYNTHGPDAPVIADHEGLGAEAALQLSMDDIIAQQKWAAALLKDQGKRSLADIQAEEEFNQYWEQETKRVQDQVKADAALAARLEKAELDSLSPGARASNKKGGGKKPNDRKGSGMGRESVDGASSSKAGQPKEQKESGKSTASGRRRGRGPADKTKSSSEETSSSRCPPRQGAAKQASPTAKMGSEVEPKRMHADAPSFVPSQGFVPRPSLASSTAGVDGANDSPGTDSMDNKRNKHRSGDRRKPQGGIGGNKESGSGRGSGCSAKA